MTELTPEQDDALKAIRGWYSGRNVQPFYLAGSAGTGKTTLAREVGDALGIVFVDFGAYTGKAAQVLRSKGCTPASTLHSLLYVPKSLPGGGVEFVLNKDESPLVDSSLLILDEVSMVNRELAEDVESFGVPVLVLGDPEQLEPIGGEGHYTSREPDFLLTQTHRFFIDGPVGKVAMAIRQSRDSSFGVAGDVVKHDVDLAMQHDQILCWRNATRWVAIEKIRQRLGRPAGVPVAGDRIMCLTNNRGLGVFNGEQFDVLNVMHVSDDWFRLEVLDDRGQAREIMTMSVGFTQEGQKSVRSYIGGRGPIMYATFSQAITVHKAQGSQWDSVYVVNEAKALAMADHDRGAAKEDAITGGRRFLYTAATRAAKRITITEARR